MGGMNKLYHESEMCSWQSCATALVNLDSVIVDLIS